MTDLLRPTRSTSVARHQRRCDICGSEHVRLFRAANEVAGDLADARRGLDQVVLDEPSDLYRCRDCCSLLRDPSDLPQNLERAYRHAIYPAPVAARLRGRARADLDRQARHWQRCGVQAGATLLEIGSYVGAFLDFARDAGCRIVGVDPNLDLARWCNLRGHDVRPLAFSAGQFAEAQFDGVWILNCFEQLPDLHTSLDNVGDVLRPGGTLVIRTPNAAFVAAVHRRGTRSWQRRAADANAVLGMPFRRCLSATAARHLLAAHGFRVIRLQGQEFSVRAPERRIWSFLHRCARRVAYRLGSLPSPGPAQPWLELIAIRQPVSWRPLATETPAAAMSCRS